MKLLEAAGYVCTRAGASLGLFDVVAVGPHDVRLIQVKSGGEYLSGVERERLAALVVPGNVWHECWRFPNRCTPIPSASELPSDVQPRPLGDGASISPVNGCDASLMPQARGTRLVRIVS